MSLNLKDTISQPPISHLPIEILQNIFLTLIQSTVGRLSPVQLGSNRCSTLECLAQLSHDQRAICSTCSSWRSAAINYPHLWTYILVDSRLWALRCLGRSKPLPVAFFGTQSWERGPDEFAHGFFSEPGRVKQIVFFGAAKWSKGWIPRLPTLCPDVEAVYVGFPDPKLKSSIMNSPSVNLSLLLSIPNLRQLGVWFHRLDWKTTHSFKATRLTSLLIQHCFSVMTSQLLSVLQQTPALELLVIMEPLSNYSNVLGPPEPLRQVVHLPRLASLCISSSFTLSVDKLLPYLRYPSSTVLDITIGSHLPEILVWGGSGLLNVMKACGLGDMSTACQLDIRFENRSKRQMTFALWDHIPRVPPSDEDIGARVTVRFVGSKSRSTYPVLALRIISAPSLERLMWTSEDPYAVGCNELRALIRGAPGLKELALLKCLTLRPYTSLFDPADRSGLISLPFLTRLELSGVDFTTSDGHLREVDVLEGMLASRKKAGAGIVSLTLKDCNCIGQGVVDELLRAQVVQEVVWDKKSDQEWVEN